MPKVILRDRKSGNQRLFDARPDRIDYRDRPYQPQLVSLPEQFPASEFLKKHLPNYTKKLILNQGKEGACTGFGLAAVINYLVWRRTLEPESSVALPNSTYEIRANAVWRRQGPEIIECVSARMLYHMARIYDEWPGEDYDGSSCRGAMKGWHRHGVCGETLWPNELPKTKKKFVKPEGRWQEDAAKRPLGAYYRVNKDSIADMQAAIYEVGAIYASAVVHEGWFLGTDRANLPQIPMKPGEAGGHAFALVGYTPDGFIVQNSWGPTWGYYGFAQLSYQDWIQHGTDSWVAVLGAPMAITPDQRTARSRSTLNLRDASDGKAAWFWRSDSTKKGFEYKNPVVEPLSESKAYEYTVVLENNGRPLNRFLDVADAADAVEEAVLRSPLDWLGKRSAPKLAIYAHGGLNDEDASINRIRVMAPYFSANEIYPLFITWRTGLSESITGMLEDVVEQFFTPAGAEPAWGWFEQVKQQVKDAKDRSIEVACEQFLVKAVWMQMKQNAAAASGDGLDMIAGHLAALKKKVPKLEIHFVGHSAGSILLGHLLDLFNSKKLTVSTLSLYAPACTVGFAVEHYIPAVQKNTLAKGAMSFDILSDERERADSLGPYGKSLLYLVSRALEDVHKMPLLGMEGVWPGRPRSADMWNVDKEVGKSLSTWQKFAASEISLRIHDKKRAQVWDGQGDIPLAHGSFDNDVDVVAKTLERIRGKALLAKVENLRGF